jgi:hypothetical protein
MEYSMQSENIDQCRQQYRSLVSLIENLSSKVSDVASNAENEFLSAYRVHMLSIQSELKDLNEQVAKAEEQLKDDGQVAKLEHEVSWFREESIRLKNNTESMFKDLNGMKTKLLSLREQKLFLSEQLKSVMKRNRVLESELELSIQGGMGSVSSEESGSYMRTGASSGGRLHYLDVDRENERLHHAATANGRKIEKSRMQSRGDARQQVLSMSRSSNQSSDLFEETRSPLEIEISEALYRAFDGISQRKITTAGNNAVSRYASMDPEEAYQTAQERIASIAGISGFGLDQFTEYDRLEAMTLFLARKDNFEQVK